MKEKNEIGITLIALVVTIILLIILAGVSLTLLLSDNGILGKAKQSQKIQDIARLSELLEVEKGEIAIDNDYKGTLSGYISQVLRNRVIEHKNILDPENIESGKCYIKLENKYTFLLEQEGDNIKITYVEDPLILKLLTEVQSSHLTVTASLFNDNLEALSKEGAEFEYSIKLEGKEYSEPVKKTSNNQHIFEGLEQNKRYCIKVKARKDSKEIEIEKWAVTIWVGTPDITVKNPNEWQNSKTVTISTLEGYVTKYSLNQTIPSATEGLVYTGPITVQDNNTTVTAIYLDSNYQTGSIATNTITKIDTLKPVGNIQVDVTTNSVLVRVSATDPEQTSKSGKSGIKGYYYSMDDGSTYTDLKTDASYTFNHISQNTTLPIKVKVVDNAGNETILTTEGTTSVVPAPTITVANANTWSTSKNVTISTQSGYTTKYTTDGTIPSATNGTAYTEAFTVTSNCTITAAYLDSTNQVGTSTNTITKIDTLKPVGNIQLVLSTNSFSISVTATDPESNSISGKSGIKGYYYSINDGVTYTELQTDSFYTFNNITQNTTYPIKVKVVDNAGNETILTKEGTTIKVPAPTITVENANTWTTSKNVTISTSSGYMIKYTTNGTIPSATNGTIYTGTFNVTSNCTITAACLDSTYQVGSSTNTITKIDRNAPTNVSLVIGYPTTTNIFELQAKGTDTESGIKAYHFYLDGSFKQTVTTTNSTSTYRCTVPFGNHSAYVIVEDNVGYKTQSSTTSFSSYVISNKSELETFRNQVASGNSYSNITIYQVENIDLQNSAWTPIGNVSNPFLGTYEGNYHTINGLYINTNSGYQGLFGRSGGTIRNLTISSPNITATSQFVGAVTGTNFGTITNVTVSGGTIIGINDCGGITGYSRGSISSCRNSATVKCPNDIASIESAGGYHIGGIAGRIGEGGVVLQCSNTGNIKAKIAGGIVGSVSDGTVRSCANIGGGVWTVQSDVGTWKGAYGGGISGAIFQSALIEYCYNTQKIQSDSYSAGGITGFETNSSNIRCCYSVGTIIANGYKGGIIGEYESGSISNNYWLNTCNASFGIGNHSSNNNCTPKTSSEIVGLTNTLGSSYYKANGNGYPLLQWQ